MSEIQKKKFYSGRQDYSCQAQFNEAGLAMARLLFYQFYIVIGAKRNKGHTNPANLTKERESRSSVYL